MIKAEKDEMFDPLRSVINDLIKGLRDRLIGFSKEKIKLLLAILKELNQELVKLDFEIIGLNIDKFEKDINEIDNLIKRNSYFDGLDSAEKVKSLEMKIIKYIQKSSSSLRDYLVSIRFKIEEYNDKQKKEIERKKTSYIGESFVIGLIVSIIIAWVCVSANFSEEEMVVISMSSGIITLVVVYYIRRKIAEEKFKFGENKTLNERENKTKKIFENIEQLAKKYQTIRAKEETPDFQIEE
jgi:hypothetical protein